MELLRPLDLSVFGLRAVSLINLLEDFHTLDVMLGYLNNFSVRLIEIDSKFTGLLYFSTLYYFFREVVERLFDPLGEAFVLGKFNAFSQEAFKVFFIFFQVLEKLVLL